MQIIKDNDVYDVVNRSEIPDGTQILNSKMDLRLRFNILLGGMIKYDARLVVLGNEEDPTDQDFFSPTCNHKALALMLALAADTDGQLLDEGELDAD